MNNVPAIVFVLVVVVGAFLLRVQFQRRRLKSADRDIVSSFRAFGAVGPQSAKTLEELDVRSRKIPFMRDYHIMALRGLMNQGAIRQGNDPQRFYLVEGELVE